MQFKDGHPYFIEFLDHGVGLKKLMTCRVMGWVLDQDDEQVTLSYWLVVTEDDEIYTENQEPYVLAKGTIKKKRLLKGVPTVEHL